MPRATLFWKVFGTSVALILITAFLVGWLAADRVVSDARAQTEEALRARVVLMAEIARPVFSGLDADAKDRVVALAHGVEARVTIIAADGSVLADSSEDPRNMENHADRPEILQSRQASFGRSTRYSVTLGTQMMYVAQRVEDDGRLLGHVRVALPLIDLDERLTRLRSAIIGAAGIAVLISLFLAVVGARRLSGPLRSMAAAATTPMAGVSPPRGGVETLPELGAPPDSFNSMAVQLGERVRTITRDRMELRGILTGMAEGVVAVDSDERIVLLNDAAGRMLGVVPASAAGTPIWEAVRLEALTKAIGVAMRENTGQRTDVRLAHDGQDRVLRLRVTPLRTPEGENAGAVMVLDDVTELVRLESVRRDFVTNASHELKTPVSAIRGLVETIVSDDEMPAETRRSFLGRIASQSERLGGLVDEMLALSRVESPDSAIARRPVDLCLAVRSAVEAALALATSRRVDLRVDLPDTPTRILGEPEALRRIAGNLLDNALKYTPEGGTVRIAVRRGDGGVVLEVSDTGPGIPPDKQERVFERFFRVDEGRSRDVGGTGLGLAIVRHLVQVLGGSIELESALGAGSTFRVRFQVA